MILSLLWPRYFTAKSRFVTITKRVMELQGACGLKLALKIFPVLNPGRSATLVLANEFETIR
jgi:hypothetical protein